MKTRNVSFAEEKNVLEVGGGEGLGIGGMPLGRTKKSSTG